MNRRLLTGVILLSLGLFAGFLGGAIIRSSAANALSATTAQVEQASQGVQMAQAQATATPKPATTPPAPGQPGQPGARPGGDGPGRGHGRGPGGDQGFGPGRGHGGDARQATADGATRAISATTQLITVVRGDLTYATGKMDTATVQDWLTRADNLLKAAQTAATAQEYGRAVATANAAGGLARAADLLMQQALGASTLPSYTQGTLRGKGGGGHHGPGIGASATVTVTQAQASRELARFYNEILAKDAVLKNTTSAGDANTYLTIVKDTYRTAYTAYQAGKFNDAHASVQVGQALLGVTESLLRAGTAPNNADTPVQVPAPNF